MIPVPDPTKKFKNISTHHNCDSGIHLPCVDGASPMWSHVEVLTKASEVKLQEREHHLQCWEDNFLEPGRPFLGTSLQRSIPHSHQHHHPFCTIWKKLNFHEQLFISLKNKSIESGKSGRWHIQAHSGSRTGLTTSATAPQSPKLPRHYLKNQLTNKFWASSPPYPYF